VAQSCPSWLTADSEDLVQVALLRVVDVLRRREEEAALSAFYLKRAAYSAVVDEIRRRRRRREVPIEDELGAVELPTRTPGPGDQAASRELGEAIRGCLGALLVSRRQAVTLRLQGHSVVDVGRLLGWDAKKAENLIYRGMADLRQCLEDKGHAP
jgi:RNA polymerase sigma-70 factor (ECF subfamily)